MTIGKSQTIITFKALPGYFKSYENESTKIIDSSKVDHLELLHGRTWTQLYKSIPENEPNVEYKFLVLGRHGQGYHNAAILRYGQEPWDTYWSFLDGDEHGSWFDSKLTPLGIEQVEATGANVYTPMVKGIGKFPDVYFSSPMRRCLETFIGSWGQANYKNGIDGTGKTIPVHMVENLRETLGEHSCDKRVVHSEAVKQYKDSTLVSGQKVDFQYPTNYSEEDQLWLADWRETDQEMDIRVHKGLVELFNQTKPDDRFISLTCHAGVIRSVLRNLDHPNISNVQTGKPVFVILALTRDAKQ